MNKPELSIIIPCYNCSETLTDAVESCFVQGLDNFEIIMVDDGSTDNTREVMKQLGEKHVEIKLCYHEINKGGGATRNTAVENSNANIIFCLDSDDILPEKVLPKMMLKMKEKNCDGVLFEETRFFSANNKDVTENVKNTVLGKSVVFEDMFKNGFGFLTKVNFLYTKKAHTMTGGYPTNHGFDTQTFGFRFLSKGFTAFVCEGTYYLHRRHAKPSYFDREYKMGNLSLNTYLMYEDFFFLFSNSLKDKIINFDIFKNKKLNKYSLDQMVVTEYSLHLDKIFIKNYQQYLTENGFTQYFESTKNLELPAEIFTQALYISKHMSMIEAQQKYSSLVEKYPKSKIIDFKINKKVVLVMHNGGRLGNQLWWIAGFYAYCLEKGYVLDLRCFFEYQEYFDIKVHSFWSRLLGKVYNFFERKGLPEAILRDSFYGVFTFWSEIFRIFKKDNIILDTDESSQATVKIFIYKRYKTVFRILTNVMRIFFKIKKEEPYAYATTHDPKLIYLPPSISKDPFFLNKPYTYFYGWLFRNGDGLVKYQKEIKKFFTPKKEIDTKITNYISDLRKSYKHVIGVHVRLGDVVNEFMNNDRIAYSESEVYTILKEFLTFSRYQAEETCFVVCSDGEIKEENFQGLHVKITHNNPVEDLWLLSKTDYIIGADSSFAITASLFGNVTFIVFKRGIDWGYYRDKKGFFVNKFVDRFIY